ncbi:MAG: hypothetical protein EA425_12460 [Puniceicoccaceae bacterium]|nr:MAG: hypothetical protein EA425_12460 [Puniceicoccaceae bacterium]
MPSPSLKVPSEWTPAFVRDELAAGKRAVVYPYAVGSIVSARIRESSVRLIEPRQALAAALPYVLLSLAAGWWALPRGPYYTGRALYGCLRGGRDVTHELAGVVGLVQPSPADRAGLRTGTAAFLAVTTVILAFAIPLATVLVWRSGQAKWHFVGGAPQTYVIEVAGESHRLGEGMKARRSLGNRAQTITAHLPTGSETFTLSPDIPLWRFLWKPPQIIINPDRMAMLVIEEAAYLDEDPFDEGRDEYTILDAFAGRRLHLVPPTDVSFDAFPDDIAVRPWERATRTRVRQEWIVSLHQRIETLGTIGKTEDRIRLLRAYGDYNPEDAQPRHLASTLLTLEDALRVYEPMIGHRPLLLGWHQSYQNLLLQLEPPARLQDFYFRLLSEEGEDPALLYLASRITTDIGRALDQVRRASTGQHGDFPGWFRRAELALLSGHPAEALDAAGRVLAARPEHFSARRIQRLARAQSDDVATWLREIRSARQATPADLRLFTDELFALRQLGRAGEGMELVGPFARIVNETIGPPGSPSIIAEARAKAAYYARDWNVYRSVLRTGDNDLNAFQLALIDGRHGEALRLAGQSRGQTVQALLIVALAAGLQGQTDLAREAVETAAAARPFEFRGQYLISNYMADPSDENAEAMVRFPFALEYRSLVLAALAVHPGIHRQRFLPQAARTNLDPDFPHHYIEGLAANP